MDKHHVFCSQHSSSNHQVLKRATVQGKYQEAARAYAKAGVVNRAMEMFSDLRLFAEAKAWSEEWERQKASRPSNATSGPGTATVALVQKQAEWSEEMKDFQAAADMYLQASLHVHGLQQRCHHIMLLLPCIACWNGAFVPSHK